MTLRLRAFALTCALALQPAEAGFLQRLLQGAPQEPAPASPPTATTPPAADAVTAADPATLASQLQAEGDELAMPASGADNETLLNWAQWGLAENSALAVINAPIQRNGLLPDPLRDDLDIPVDVLDRDSYHPYGDLLPYVIKGEPYSLKSMTTGKRQEGVASWYGPGFNGRRTASGEIFNMHQLTAAHRTLPLPSFVRVTNLANQQSVIVRINDRGPFHAGRILDLSYAAARKIGMLHTGRVSIEPVEVSHREPILRSGIPLPAAETLYSVTLGNFTDLRAAQALQGRLMSRLPPGIPVNISSSKLPVQAQRVEVGPLLSMQEVKLLIRTLRAVRMGLHVDMPRQRPGKP